MASREEMMEMLPGRPWHEIRRCAHKLKVKRGFPDRTGTKNPHWTPEEDRVIRDYDEGRIAYSEMLEAPEDRPYAGIVRRAGILGMEFSKRRIVLGHELFKGLPIHAGVSDSPVLILPRIPLCRTLDLTPIATRLASAP